MSIRAIELKEQFQWLGTEEAITDAEIARALKSFYAERLIEETQLEELRRIYVAAAKEQAVEGEIEVDDNAIVSFGDDNGAYVEAWIWVSENEAPKVRIGRRYRLLRQYRNCLDRGEVIVPVGHPCTITEWDDIAEWYTVKFDDNEQGEDMGHCLYEPYEVDELLERID